MACGMSNIEEWQLTTWPVHQLYGDAMYMYMVWYVMQSTAGIASMGEASLTGSGALECHTTCNMAFVGVCIAQCGSLPSGQSVICPPNK